MKIIETRPALTSSWSKFENVPLYEIKEIKHSFNALDYDLLIFQSPSAAITFNNLPKKISLSNYWDGARNNKRTQ